MLKTYSTIAVAICAAALAGAAPLAKAPKFDGKFLWIKLAPVPAASLKTLAKAKTIKIGITFGRDVRVKKDAKGYQWFTLIVADQGGDWKWHQTSGSGTVPLSSGVVRAGSYSIAVPVAGIPASVLAGKPQTISVGPASSGLAGPASFTINTISGE